MGEYWKPVNLTKREYIHPHDCGDGLKLGEWTYPGSPTLQLMAELWSDTDVVVYVSDYEGAIVAHGNPESGDVPAYQRLDEDGYTRVRR